MPKIAYKTTAMRGKRLAMIEQANAIIAEYQAQGFVLTVRQLYYQFVSRDLVPNTVKSYKLVADVINEGRLQGLIDWEAIEDRTRGIEILSAWSSPADIVAACADQFRYRLWDDQSWHVEVWIEKEALAGVIEGVCKENRVPYLSCRGYTSQSEMWRCGGRLREIADHRKDILILHLGDHDPSGIDMSRDIQDRLKMFMGRDYPSVSFRRIALNRDQVDQYNPPPNPAKVTDARFASYERLHGSESWELDALEPSVLTALIQAEIDAVRSPSVWNAAVARERVAKRALASVAQHWGTAVDAVAAKPKPKEEKK